MFPYDGNKKNEFDLKEINQTASQKNAKKKSGELNDQKQQAILVLQETKKLKVPDTLIKDKNHNDDFKA